MSALKLAKGLQHKVGSHHNDLSKFNCFEPPTERRILPTFKVGAGATQGAFAKEATVRSSIELSLRELDSKIVKSKS